MSSKPRILILDTYYPEVIRAMPVNPAGTYDSELKAILHQSFGTFDAYSRNLRALEWDAEDVIVNHEQLNSIRPRDPIAVPDVLFFQDLSVDHWTRLEAKVIGGQLSCPWPGDDAVRKCDVIFTSFPHYVPRIEALGVKAVYNPLAFDPVVIERIKEREDYWDDYEQSGERPYDVVFIGGVGNPGHWKRGMETLNAVAEAIPTFKWWGYGDMNGCGPALSRAYQGQAWGLDMYRILLQSKIVLNRHGEVAEGFTNNMRCFEATGCGTLLLTEHSQNLRDLFDLKANDWDSLPDVATYVSPDECIRKIRYLLHAEGGRSVVAANGQRRTLRDHTYSQRMRTVSETLKEMLNV